MSKEQHDFKVGDFLKANKSIYKILRLEFTYAVVESVVYSESKKKFPQFVFSITGFSKPDLVDMEDLMQNGGLTQKEIDNLFL